MQKLWKVLAVVVVFSYRTLASLFQPLTYWKAEWIEKQSEKKWKESKENGE